MVKLYASLGDAYRDGNRAAFNQDVDLVLNRIASVQPIGTKRASYEFFFNSLIHLRTAMILYVLAFLLACISWLAWNARSIARAFYLLLLALAVHRFGLFSACICRNARRSRIFIRPRFLSAGAR